MPLDGDDLNDHDEIGLFCILLPQTMDRSMKNIQAWRPYEVHNDGDGRKFENDFVLLTLRNIDQDIGTKDTILTVFKSRQDGVLAKLHRAFSVSSTKTAPLNKRKLHAESVGDLNGHNLRRTNPAHSTTTLLAEVPVDVPTNVSGVTQELTTPVEPPRPLSEPRSGSTASATRQTLQPSVNDSALPPDLTPDNSDQDAAPVAGSSTAAHTASSSDPTRSILTEEQAKRIQVTWSWDMDGHVCQLHIPLTQSLQGKTPM